MQKKDYQKPVMIMVKLHHSTRLLVDSGNANNVSAKRNGYEYGGQEEWGNN